MKKTIDIHDFHEAFERAGRHNQISRPAREALFAYLEAFEEGSGTELELDVVELCCDYTEYETAIEAAMEYGYEPDTDRYTDDEIEELAAQWLADRTTVIPLKGGVIVQTF